MADRLDIAATERPASLRRRLVLGVRRVAARTTLSQRFLALATVVVTIAVVLLGYLTVLRLESSITRGVALTAASSIDALLGRDLEADDLNQPLGPLRRAQLDDVFNIGNGAETTRLMQIRLFGLDATPRYEANDVFATDPPLSGDFRSVALEGQVVAGVADVVLEAVGPVPPLPVKVLEILTPVHDRSEKLIGVAQLYLSATSLIGILDEARWQAWLTVGGIGAAVIFVLYQLVDVWSRMISSHRRRLEENLVRSRQLSKENQRLHADSEQLRIEAGLANENLLGKVGSDIHDGPIQLLTLLILRLSHGRSRTGGTEDDLANEKLATETMEELRNISTGLVLPELADLTLAEVLALAATRHENSTGSSVELSTANLPHDFPLDVRVCAYRVVQEALTNAFRHAAAVQQEVTAKAAGGTLILTISNGVWATATNAAPPDRKSSGLGLKGMRFRVESLGGTLDVEIGADRAVVTARIPYRSDTASGTRPSDSGDT